MKNEPGAYRPTQKNCWLVGFGFVIIIKHIRFRNKYIHFDTSIIGTR